MFWTRRIHTLALLTLTVILLLFGTSALANSASERSPYTTEVSAIEAQDAIDAALLSEAALGYSFAEPLCVVNPYGNVPLCALLIFDTAEETTVSMTVKGHDPADDVSAVFPAATRHILPVIGLYANEDNTVELSLPDGSKTIVVIQTEDINNDALLKGDVTVPYTSAYDSSKLTFVSIGNTQCVAAYDMRGDLRYYAEFKAKRTTPFRQLSNGHYLVASDNTAEATEAFGGIMEVDLCGRISKQYKLPGGFHHGIIEMPNGNFLVASSQDDVAVLMDTIVEIDRKTGDIVWTLDQSDIIDSTDGSGTLYKETDWSHTNAVSYDEETDTVLMSCRALDAVVAVNHATKEIVWILGNPEGWTNMDPALFFTPAEGQDDFEWNYAQHNASFIDSTHVLMFDNGTNRYKTVTPEDQRNTEHYSRAVLYAIDTETMTIKQDWSYGKDRGLEWYSSHFCGVDYLADNDEYWICSGTTVYDTSTETYILNANEADNPEAVVTLAKIDMVQGSELLYELVLEAPAYRAVRYNPYEYATMTDLTTPGSLYSYTKAE